MPEDEGHGELFAVVQAKDFKGKGSAWFNLRQIREHFIPALRKFPISDVNAPVLSGGTWTDKGLENIHARIKPFNRQGALLVQVDLGTDVWRGSDIDLRHSVTTRFVTEYSEIERFATELERHLSGECDCATLRSVWS